MKDRNIRQSVKDCTKIVGAGVTIVLIAWAVGVFDVDGQVPEAEADIVDLFFGRKSSVDAFQDALHNLGHGEPQVYDLNGNVIYFSVQHSEMPVQRVVREYQDEFVAVGLNDRAYYKIDDLQDQERFVTGMTGGVVPHIITPTYATLGGMITKGDARTHMDVLKEYGANKDEDALFKGHRWIEIFEEPESGETTVIASWSDDNFVYSKMIPGLNRHQNQSFDPEVPACPGCERVNRFADIGGRPSPHESNIFVTNHSVEQVRHFYQWAMASRGWKAVDEGDLAERIRHQVDFDDNDATVLVFKREERHLRVMLFTGDDGTTNVHTSLTREM